MHNFEPKPLEWPDVDPELEAAIGRAILSWSVLEHEVDDALRLIIRVTPGLGDCVAANLQLKSRLDIIQAAAHSLLYSDGSLDGEMPDEDVEAYRQMVEADRQLLESAEHLAKDTQHLAEKLRNWIAHGRPHRRENCDGWNWVRRSARKGGVQLRVEAMVPSVFDNGTRDIRQLVERWRNFNGRVHRYMELESSLDVALANWDRGAKSAEPS